MIRLRDAWPMVLLLGVSAPSRADVVEPGYVETCTLERVQAQHAGEVCVACDANYEAPERCTEQFAESGVTNVCRSGGASVWTHIGCRARTADDPGPPPPGPGLVRVITQPATSQPATTQPATTQPATTQPATTSTEGSSGCAVSAHAPSFGLVALVLGAMLASVRRRSR